MDLDFCICLPILFGCPTKIKQDGDPSMRMCPRCNNASVYQAKSRTWFELCCVPIIPMGSDRIWYCSICQWQVNRDQGGWEPAVPGAYGPPPGGAYGPPQGGYGWQPGPQGPMYPQQAHSGYGPGYNQYPK